MPAPGAYRSPRKVYFALALCLLGLTGDGVVGEECYRRGQGNVSRYQGGEAKRSNVGHGAILGPDHVTRLPV